jgi:glycine/D-amino acid oxidase-like deaminating enzyme
MIETKNMTFDIIVIGKGLIGCAAAKYLSRKSIKVAIIGTDEPENYEKATIFSSHYDGGRVFRQLGKNLAMTSINHRAHKEYPLLERESEIDFHSKNGCLYVNPYGNDDYLDKIEKRSKLHDVKINQYKSGKEIKRDFPFLSFPEKSNGMFESAPSGHINPRLLIKAQLKVVEKNDGIVINGLVTEVIYKSDYILVKTDNGRTFKCQKVIFATGAFTNFFGLLKEKLDLTLKSETVILAQIHNEDIERYKSIPSLLYEVNNPEIEGIYSTQPIKYPDGNYYLKIGANLPQDIYFKNGVEEIKKWFVNGNSDANIQVIENYLRSIFLDLKFNKAVSKRCILTRTNSESGNPYISTIKKGRSYIAVGNAWSGGNSDGIGYIVAMLAIDEKFPEGFYEKDFNLIYANDNYK